MQDFVFNLYIELITIDSVTRRTFMPRFRSSVLVLTPLFTIRIQTTLLRLSYLDHMTGFLFIYYLK